MPSIPSGEDTDLGRQIPDGAFITKANATAAAINPHLKRRIRSRMAHNNQPITAMAMQLAGPPEFEAHTIEMHKTLPAAAHALLLRSKTTRCREEEAMHQSSQGGLRAESCLRTWAPLPEDVGNSNTTIVEKTLKFFMLSSRSMATYGTRSQTRDFMNAFRSSRSHIRHRNTK